MDDPNVAIVCAKIRERSELGIQKYGMTTAENTLTLFQWLTHLQEELMDATVYIERIKSEISGGDEP